MLQGDKLKIDIIELLKKKGEMTLGQLKKDIKIPHHYTLTNALEFLKEIEIIDVKEKKDKLNSKVVRLK